MFTRGFTRGLTRGLTPAQLAALRRVGTALFTANAAESDRKEEQFRARATQRIIGGSAAPDLQVTKTLSQAQRSSQLGGAGAGED